MREICLLIIFFAPSFASNCSENLTNGYRLESFTTEIIGNIGVHTCIKECHLRKPHCLSINYNVQHFQCGINSRGAEDIQLEGVQDSNSIFANVVNASQENLGTCEDAICPVLHKCVPMKNTNFCISTACKAGTYGKEDQCLPCPVGQYNDGSKQWCSYCKPGSYSDQTGSNVCKLCPAGKYMDPWLYGEVTDSCKLCPTGSYQSEPGKTSCPQCPVGSYQDQKGESFCKNCSRGYFQSNEGKTACLQCPVGTYQDEERQFYCKNCTVDTYQDLKGQPSCKNCSDYRQCTNPSRTKCHDLKRHEKRHGHHGHYEGNFAQHDCKQRCQERHDCRGFTVSRTDHKSCHTHSRTDHFEHDWSNFLEYPSDCRP